MLSANFKPKRTAAASRGFLATARLSCLYFLVWREYLTSLWRTNTARQQKTVYEVMKIDPYYQRQRCSLFTFFRNLPLTFYSINFPLFLAIYSVQTVLPYASSRFWLGLEVPVISEICRPLCAFSFDIRFPSLELGLWPLPPWLRQYHLVSVCGYHTYVW